MSMAQLEHLVVAWRRKGHHVYDIERGVIYKEKIIPTFADGNGTFYVKCKRHHVCITSIRSNLHEIM